MKDYEKDSNGNFKNNYFVLQVRYENDQWRVIRIDKNTERFLLSAETKKKAKEKAFSSAEKYRPAKVFIYRMDGSRQTSRTFKQRRGW